MNCEWIGWCAMDPNGQAAWVQAVGSVAAIVVAVGVAWWQRRKALADRAESDARAARSLAVVVLRDVRKLRQRLRDVRKEVPEPHAHNVAKDPTPIKIPQQLWEAAPTLQFLGDASTPVIDALANVQEARELLDGGSLWGDRSAEFIDHLDLAITRCTDAERQLRGLLGLTDG